MAGKTNELALFYLADANVGGWHTYACHLVKSFEALGFRPRIVRMKETTEPRYRPFAMQIPYQNVAPDVAVGLVRSMPSLILAVGMRRHDDARLLLDAGCPAIVTHDPNESGGDARETFSGPAQLITVREGLRRRLSLLRDLDSIFIPLPYVPYAKPSVGRWRHAVTTSRLDYDKLSHLIIEANDRLPVDKVIEMFGQAHAPYIFRKIAPEYPHWKKYHRGAYPTGGGVRLARSSVFSVDMSVMVGDGGGNQYSFFEAWDAGAVLIAHERWNSEVDDVIDRDHPTRDVVDGETALCVSDVDELVDAVLTDRDLEPIRAAARARLSGAAPEIVAPLYLDAMKVPKGSGVGW